MPTLPGIRYSTNENERIKISLRITKLKKPSSTRFNIPDRVPVYASNTWQSVEDWLCEKITSGRRTDNTGCFGVDSRAPVDGMLEGRCFDVKRSDKDIGRWRRGYVTLYTSRRQLRFITETQGFYVIMDRHMKVWVVDDMENAISTIVPSDRNFMPTAAGGGYGWSENNEDRYSELENEERFWRDRFC